MQELLLDSNMYLLSAQLPDEDRQTNKDSSVDILQPIIYQSQQTVIIVEVTTTQAQFFFHFLRDFQGLKTDNIDVT